MDDFVPARMSDKHREFLHRGVERLAREKWLVGIAVTGSYCDDAMDRFSDLDFVLAIEGEKHAAVLMDRIAVAESLGGLLSAFTGEHVGEPRLLICLYGPPLLHVDIMFSTLDDIANRTDSPCVLWERDRRMSSVLQTRAIAVREIDDQWIEDRFWVWIHKALGMTVRGELFQALDYLAYLRSKVLGPLGLRAAGCSPVGVRRIESAAPALAQQMQSTVAAYDGADCMRAIRACVELYGRFRRPESDLLRYRGGAESAVRRTLASTRLRGSEAATNDG